MKNKLPIAIWALLSLLWLGGCAGPQPPQWRNEAIAVDQASFDQVWDACVDSLKDKGMVIDRQDRRFGIITTKPMVGKQFFEFWRNDAANSDDPMLSSMHTIRRTVNVRVTSQGPTRYQVAVEAQAQRASLPGGEVDSVVEAFELLDRQGVSPYPRRRDYTKPKPKPEWVDLGREPALEQNILADISERLKS